MAEACCAPEEVLIFTCSGGSDVGQLANQAAVELQQEGVGKMLCIAGIGGHIPGMLASAKAGKRLVGIDGCMLACTKKTMEHAGLSLTDYIVVTSLGIETGGHKGSIDKGILKKLKDEVKRQIGLTHK